MVRTIPAATQTRLETDLGASIIIVLEVFWTGSTQSKFYADREISGTQVKGKILSMTNFNEAIQVSGGGQSQSFSVTLDDTDGEIKEIFDANDVHKVPVQVWFYEAETNFNTDKFEVFLGQINSPVEWSEGERTFTLSVINRIEDKEVGFSAEEGEFAELPEDLIGKTWPLCFGTTINVPALRAVPAISGQLAGGVGIADFTLQRRLVLAEDITCPQTLIGLKCRTEYVGGNTYKAVCNNSYEIDKSCEQAKCYEIEKLKLQIEEQQEYEYAQVTIFGGKKFPQGRVITLNINGGLFRGFFNGTTTNPSNVFRINNRTHPEDDGSGGVKSDDYEEQIKSACPSAIEDAEDSDWSYESAYGPIWTGQRQSRLSWEAYRDVKAAGFFWAAGGQTVVMEDRQEIIYIANIVPSTILRVAAWRTINGNRFLLTVPSEFFTVRQVDYGGYQVMEIVFDRPLSSEQDSTGGGWTDEIYITQRSSVGPNTVDILKWFIETYTSYSYDSTSFNAVRTKIDNYPMHFPLLRRANILTILQELSQRARCALWQKQDTFYIKYLAEEPSSVATIEEDDILQDDGGRGSLEVFLTDTEALVTKFTGKWKKDYSITKDNTLILRHNVIKYGTHDREDDYYPYAHLDLVRKSMTYWLIRWANTWKKVRFSTSLEFMKLEPFDCITLDLPDVASEPIKAIVERATLDSNGKQIDFEVWTPVRAGEQTAYDFAWPANIAEVALFPTQEARDRKQAGSGSEPNFSTVAPPGHPLETNTSGVYQGMQLGCNGAGVISLEPGECRQDHGDRHPSDTGDQKPTVDVNEDTTGDISGGTSPVTNGAGYGFWSNWQIWRDATKKTEQDAGRGREGSSRNTNDIGSDDVTYESDIDREALDNLPDPDDVQGDCQIRVTVTGFQTEEQGTRPICVPATSGYTDVYVFDSTAAASSFCGTLTASSNCGSVPPCGNCIGSCIVTGSCDPEDEGEGNLIGFRGGNASHSFMTG
ncbi:MAG: hypothetical protein ACYSWO_21760 [Planctomycetota bacterium]|jgi:hypothetical protein